MDNAVKATTRRDHDTIEMRRRKLSARASYEATTKAIADMATAGIDAEVESASGAFSEASSAADNNRRLI